MFDLSTLDTRGASERGAVLTLRHPVSGDELRTKEGEAVTITLLGIDSEKSEALQREVQRKALKRAGRKARTPEHLENEALNLLAGLTVAWTNVGRGEEQVDCTTENAKMIYKEFPWIRTQVDEFIGDVSNYLGN